MSSFNESSIIGQDVVELVVNAADSTVLEQSLVSLNVVLQKLIDTKNPRLKDIKIFYKGPKMLDKKKPNLIEIVN